MNHSELRSFFYGTLLGDSYIHNGIFYCKQISEDLINFKANIIDQYLPDAKVRVTAHNGYVDKNGVNHQDYWQLNAPGSKYIRDLEKLFYPNGYKICPPHVIDKLDNLGMAMWYADDGSTVLVQFNPTTKSSRSRRTTICTDSFTKEEHDNIIVPELGILGYDATYVTRNNHYRINIRNCKDCQRLMLNIGPYFYKYFPSLIYKMDMGYRNESLDNKTYVLPEYKDFFIKISAHPEFVDRLQGREDIVQTTTL